MINLYKKTQQTRFRETACCSAKNIRLNVPAALYWQSLDLKVQTASKLTILALLRITGMYNKPWSKICLSIWNQLKFSTFWLANTWEVEAEGPGVQGQPGLYEIRS